MKKCVIFSGIYPPDIGGPATYVPKLERYLRSAGWAVDVICLADQSERLIVDEDKGMIRLSRKVPKVFRVPLLCLSIGKRFAKTDVIFANGMHEEASLISIVFRKVLVCKVVGNPVWEDMGNRGEIDSRDGLDSFHKMRLTKSRKIRLFFWKFALRVSHTITTPSRGLKDHLVNLGVTSTIHVIGNGTEIYEIDSPKPEFDVITVSRLVEWKNVNVLVRAALDFGFTLCVVGDGPESDSLIRLANRANNILFTGNLSAEQTRHMLLSSKIFSLVSSYEGQSFSLLEALAAGRPCVLSDIPANRDVIQDSECALFVELNNIRATGEAVIQLMKNANQLKHMGQESRFLAESNFNIDLKLKKMSELLDAV